MVRLLFDVSHEGHLGDAGEERVAKTLKWVWAPLITR